MWRQKKRKVSPVFLAQGSADCSGSEDQSSRAGLQPVHFPAVPKMSPPARRSRAPTARAGSVQCLWLSHLALLGHSVPGPASHSAQCQGQTPVPSWAGHLSNLGFCEKGTHLMGHCQKQRQGCLHISVIMKMVFKHFWSSRGASLGEASHTPTVCMCASLQLMSAYCLQPGSISIITDVPQTRAWSPEGDEWVGSDHHRWSHWWLTGKCRGDK